MIRKVSREAAKAVRVRRKLASIASVSAVESKVCIGIVAGRLGYLSRRRATGAVEL